MRFDDPGAWGYCRYCAFQVAVDEAGLILPHERIRTSFKKYPCPGSLEEPTVQESPEMVMLDPPEESAE